MSGLQAAQVTGKAASHPAYWCGGMPGRSWDDDSHHIVTEALKALSGDGGALPALNFMRRDLGHDVGAQAIAALRDDNGNVDPNDPSNKGCDSSLVLEESEESDLGNSWDSSNVDPDDPYGGGAVPHWVRRKWTHVTFKTPRIILAGVRTRANTSLRRQQVRGWAASGQKLTDQ
jgi:hypothetical protein